MVRISLQHRRTPFVAMMLAYSKRVYGKVLDPGLVALHNRRVLSTMLKTERSAARWNTLPADLASLAVMASSAVIGCSWCIDFGYWEAHSRGVSPDLLRAVPGWRENNVFDEHQRQVLGYAEAMSVTPPEVTDEMVDELRTWLTDAQLVELTALIALENQRSRTNAAMGLTSQGFKEFCEFRPTTTGPSTTSSNQFGAAVGDR